MRRSTDITQFPQIGVTTSIVEFAKPSSPYPFFRAFPALPVTAEPVNAQVILQELAKLKRDWDGYDGAARLRRIGCAHAQRFLAVTPQGMSAPWRLLRPQTELSLLNGNPLGVARSSKSGRTRDSGHIQPKYGETLHSSRRFGNRARPTASHRTSSGCNKRTTLCWNWLGTFTGLHPNY